jgi:hypothetical protein
MAASTSSTNFDKDQFIPVYDSVLFDKLNKWFTIHLDEEEALEILSEFPPNH